MTKCPPSWLEASLTGSLLGFYVRDPFLSSQPQGRCKGAIGAYPEGFLILLALQVSQVSGLMEVGLDFAEIHPSRCSEPGEGLRSLQVSGGVGKHAPAFCCLGTKEAEPWKAVSLGQISPFREVSPHSPPPIRLAQSPYPFTQNLLSLPDKWE